MKKTPQTVQSTLLAVPTSPPRPTGPLQLQGAFTPWSKGARASAGAVAGTPRAARRAREAGAAQLPLTILVACVAASIGIGALLLPSARPRATDPGDRPDTGSPRLAIFEQALSSSEQSPTRAAALARARAQRGDLDGAIRLMAPLVEIRENDPAALRALAGYLQQARRHDDELRVRERLKAIDPDVQGWQDLARLYGATGQKALQRAALEALAASDEALMETDDLMALARLQRPDDPFAAAVTLGRLAASRPKAVDAVTMTMYMEALNASGNIERAVRIGHHWLAAAPERLDNHAARFAAALITPGRYAAAAEFLQRYAFNPLAAPGLLVVWAQARIDAGGGGEALARLKQARDAGIGDAASQLLHLRLALALDDRADVLRVAAGVDLGSLSPADLARFHIAALRENRLDVLDAVPAPVGEALLRADPWVAAQVRLALGDVPAATRASQAAARELRALTQVTSSATDGPNGPANRAIDLARLQQQLGERVAARTTLELAASLPGLTDTALPELARLYIALGAAEEGHRHLTRRRAARPSTTVDQAWALTAAATGRRALLQPWLETEAARGLDAGFYRDLTQLAFDARQPGLAVACGLRLLAVRGSAEDRLLVTHARVAAGEGAALLGTLRELSRDDPSLRPLYTQSLFAAWRQGQPVGVEIRAHWAARLARADGAAARDEAVTALVEIRADAEVMPALQALAIAQPQRWLGTFTTVAQRSGHMLKLHEVWLRIGNDETSPAALRGQVAYRLLEGGDKPAAERIVRQLAENARPGDAALARLLHLWGPRPTTEQIDWLEAHARQGVAVDRGPWLRELLRVGAARRAIAVYESQLRDVSVNETGAGADTGPGTGTGEGTGAGAGSIKRTGASDSVDTSTLALVMADAHRAYIDALVATNDRAGVVRAIRAALVSTSASTSASRADATSAATSVPLSSTLRSATAVTASADTPSVGPGAAAAYSSWTRWNELAARFGDVPLQRDVLRRQIASGTADASSHRHFGMLAWRARDHAEAEASLLAHEAATGGDEETQTLLGELSARRGDVSAARRHFERAVLANEAAREPSYERRAARARLLQRLGHAAQAQRHYDELLAERSDDRHLRADFAASLLAAGRLDQAASVLVQP